MFSTEVNRKKKTSVVDTAVENVDEANVVQLAFAGKNARSGLQFCWNCGLSLQFSCLKNPLGSPNGYLLWYNPPILMARRSYCNHCLSIDYNPGVLHQFSMAGFVARTPQDHWWEPEQISTHCWWCDHQNDHQTITDYNFYQTMMSLGWFTYSSSIGIMVQTWVQWIQLYKTIADPLQVEVMGYLHQKLDGTESQRTPVQQVAIELIRYSGFFGFRSVGPTVGDFLDFPHFSSERYGVFLKWWYPTTMGFPTKNDHFGVFWGFSHHFRKQSCGYGRFRLFRFQKSPNNWG